MQSVLTIAGSDSCGGAGIQADLKTFEAFGVYGASVVTVLTAQNTTGVKDIFEVDAKFVKAQIDSILDDFDIKVIKVGMLFNKKIIKTVKDAIKDLDIPIVLDPVFVSKAGSALLETEAIKELKDFCQYAKVITPNLYEAKQLFDYNENEEHDLAKIRDYKTNVLIKKHKKEINDILYSIDYLYTKTDIKSFYTPYIRTKNVHGTGCTLSSSIAANLALGKDLEEAIRVSKEYVYEAILKAPNLGKGSGVINHKV
ncbi:hydroxymethylpyrimidine kinase / phosphohydroxymethylpyrimidine kinase [Malaciobacter marinus]|uniref:hydroxymethylpyrimidine kinase n=1 Tax=Malaciobacter marinus TaxID=505249 RepID=A0A347TMK7_9BACT|nr:bifunctional hydroxymethylpyrimidine kinase/phosphomethylpyrimidine kinase [Malaciobacter marinus]AXX87835.1 hydroxymethylpyrimidine kinase / phosphohydroxymethylpyrimidine kinase [Malaciobacter marinus]PHO11481.1 bifunctional hydroxymethylpyrimidine kinase/phosphomethylpyrimidine kinase [Malaciobacter marinus]PHO16118.1 bifunctional hydroxymethylpyrimidine kinase/phosphomethylpyrimidine kinase [Malaciobacter marinus]